MFKLMTSVYTVLVLILSPLLPTVGFAADNNSGNNVDPAKCATEYAKNMTTAKKGTPAYQKVWKKGLQACKGGDADYCEQSMKNYNDAKTELGAACKKSGMKGGGVTGSIACSSEISKCLDASKLGSSLDEDSDDPYDVAQMQDKKNKCPASNTNGEEIKQELKDVKTEIRELKNDLKDLEEEAAEEEKNSQTEALDLQQQTNDAKNECKTQQKELERGLADKEKAIQDQVGELNGQILTLNDQIGQMESAKVQAGSDFAKTRMQLELECHALAISKVNEKRKAILAKVATSSYNVGGMQNLMKKVGKSTRKADQEEALSEYTYCVNSDTFKKPLLVAKDAYTMTVSNSDRQLTLYKGQRDQAMSQIGVLLNNERARVQNETAQDLADMSAACGQKVSILEQKLGLKQADIYSGQASSPKAKKLNTVRRDLELAENRQKNIIQAARIADGGSTGENFSNLMGAAGGLEGAAQTYLYACCQENPQLCSEIKAYMASLGKSTDNSSALAAAAASTPEVISSTPVAPASATTTATGKDKKVGSKKPAKTKTTDRLPSAKPSAVDRDKRKVKNNRGAK